jgi:polyhydroxybutyrate depolymerase
MRRPSAVLAVALLVVACGGPASSPVASAPPEADATPVPPVATSGPGATSSGAIVVGGDRPVAVHVPASYDPSKPAPLLILLHGYTDSGAGIERYFDVASAAERLGFVYAAPDGTVDADGNRFWNATDACCNFHGSAVDDVAYLSSVIEEIQGKLAIDPKRIGVAGHSNGGFMSYRMACERADLIAGIVSAAGETFADPADCTPSSPVSVVQAQGTADDVILFDGRASLTDGTGPYPGAEGSAEIWAKNDGCGPMSPAIGVRMDITADTTDAGDKAETSVRRWSGCDDGSAVELWTIQDADHGPRFTRSFADAFLQFLIDHPKP